MSELILTSSVLILILIFIRQLFRGKVKQKLIYGMWLLAIVSHAAPVQLIQTATSMNETGKQLAERVNYIVKSRKCSSPPPSF